MIEFPCHCHRHTFRVGEDLSGDVVQCPKCGRLNDVPTHNELLAIDADGTFKLEAEPVAPATDETLARMNLAFTRKRVDAAGHEIDLRVSTDDLIDVGGEVLPLAGEVAVDRPQYDPTTGELIRPLEMKNDLDGIPLVNPAHIPIAKPLRGLAYAVNDSGPSHIAQIVPRLLTPGNVFVIACIFFGHALVQPVMLMMQAGLFLVAPLWIMAMMFFVSHYGNVIDETGPGLRDELPRPLREASLSEDIWRPFVAVIFSLAICFGPFQFFRTHDAPVVAQLLLLLVGTLTFPAMVLTAVTSGTTFNMRPDRVIGVIRVIGIEYALIVAGFTVAAGLYILGLWRFDFDSILLFVPAGYAVTVRSSVAWWFMPWITYPALFTGIALMHAFCWALGMMYRRHHEQFPWILQRHLRVNEDRTVTRISRTNPSANSQRARQALNR